MERKSFMDIDAIREKDLILVGGVNRKNNVSGFVEGDIIQVSTKIDGSNASATFDVETNTIKAFSRKMELTGIDGLNGFKSYIMSLNPDIFKNSPDYIIFGEWLANSTRINKITYDRQFGWVIYDIYDKKTNKWQAQDIVKKFAEDNNLEYIEVLYEGPFISWEHCKSFMHSSKYGKEQEGIVVKNKSEMMRNYELSDKEYNGDTEYPNSHHNWVLKIVNEKFAESMMKKPRVIDEAKMKEKEKIIELINQVVTKNRVEKILGKLIENGILPKELTNENLRDIAKVMPREVYNDCKKEEPEIMEKCGESGGKICASATMAIIRELIA